MNRKRLLFIAAAIAIAATVAAISVSISGATPAVSKRASDVAQTLAAVKAQFGDSRIRGATITGSTLKVVLSGGDPAETTLERFEGKVLARAVAADLAASGQDTVTGASYVDASGADLNATVDAVHPAPPSTALAEGSCESAAQANPPAGAIAVTARTIPLIGGVCVFSVKVADVASFAADAPARLGGMLSAIPDVSNHPYVVTATDTSGNPELILAWIPAIGGSEGQGLGWTAPGVVSPAVLGTAAGRNR